MNQEKISKMEFKPQIEINGIVFSWVNTQRGGLTAIYKDNSTFLRIGSPEKIKKDLLLHKKLAEYGFPIAQLLDEGQIGEMHYFIEKSLGSEHFGTLFQKEFNEQGHITDETFDKFMIVCEKFVKSQLKTLSLQKDWDNFRTAIHLDVICEELPEYKEKIINAYEKVKEKLSVYPFVLTHGDFTPFNILPEGIIDIENAFSGPAGYDLGGILATPNWFPDSTEYEFHQVYKLTPEQKQKFIDKIDNIYVNNSLPKISNYLEEFNFTKGMWFTAKMHRFPKLQKFRYYVLKNLVDKIS